MHRHTWILVKLITLIILVFVFTTGIALFTYFKPQIVIDILQTLVPTPVLEKLNPRLSKKILLLSEKEILRAAGL